MNKSHFNDEHYIYFVTSKTFKNFPYFQDGNNCHILLKNIDYYRKRYKFKLYGFVIMPDHVHLMIEPVIVADGVKPSAEHEISKNTACLGDGFIPSQIQRIIHDIKNKTDGVKPSAKREVDKSKFCLGDGFIPSQIQRIIHDIKGKTAFDIRRSKSINNKIWQKSFYQIQIYSEKFFNQKLTYIHENPLKSQLVKDPADYPWSSYRNIYLDVHSLIEVDRPIL